MSSENEDDDECWDVTDGIINNADCTQKMCDKTVWFERESELELNRYWDDVIKCDCDEIFWAVSDANSNRFELKEDNCDICESDCICLTGCDDCNTLKLSCCKN